jgi:hypothetical protein
MVEYGDMLASTISDDDYVTMESKNVISEDYPVSVKSDDGENFIAVKESMWETYNNPEKSSIGDKIRENFEVFTKDGKEYLGIKRENLTNEFDPYLDKYEVVYYPDEGTHEVFTSGSELSELYKNIDVPENLVSKYRGGEVDIDTDTIDVEPQFSDLDAAMIGI